MIDRKDWPEDARNAQAAFDEASWDAVEGYRDTGEMVPGMKDGKLYLYVFPILHPPSHLLTYLIHLSCPRAPALSALLHARLVSFIHSI